MEQNESMRTDEVTVVPPEVYEQMVASLDEPTELSHALTEAVRQKRAIIQNK